MIERARVADVTWVESMCGKHRSLPTDKLVSVSASGFTKPALDKAKHENVEALTVDDALDVDWGRYAELVDGGYLGLVEIKYSCTAIYAGSTGQLTQVELPLEAELIGAGGPVPAGTFVHSMLHQKEVRNALQEQIYNTDERDFWCSFKNEGIAFRLGDSQHSLLELRIALKASVSKTPIQITFGRYGGTNSFRDQRRMELPFNTCCLRKMTVL